MEDIADSFPSSSLSLSDDEFFTVLLGSFSLEMVLDEKLSLMETPLQESSNKTLSLLVCM